MRENKISLRQAAKDNQIFQGKFVSEDLLIRSHKEISKNILPYLKQMNHPAVQEVKELATFSSHYSNSNNNWRGNQNVSIVGEEEARDNFFREQAVEEEYKKRTKIKSKVFNQMQRGDVMRIEAKSSFKKTAQEYNRQEEEDCLNEINDSDLDLLLEELDLEEEISDSDMDLK